MKNDSDDDLKRRFKELCSDLNLDKGSADEAWLSYQRIGINYTLEGQKLHWLACAVYVACRKCVTQTVGKVVKIEGNLVSLTRLLRSCKLSLVQFFNKMKKWSDMANLSSEMRQKVDHLERNFNVSTVIFKKYKPIFNDVFKDPTVAVARHPKNRKQKGKQSIAPSDIFSFCWTLFVHTKSNFPQISDDLVNSYHLLLTCIDYCYANALAVDSPMDLLNANFSELPTDLSGDSRAREKQCIVQALCEKWDGISLEAKTIKEHWCKPFIKRLNEKHILRTNKNHTIFDAEFESNSKNIMKEYDQYVLNIGDFDERVFLNDNAHEELGTPQCQTEELAELMQSRQTGAKHHDDPNALVPTTPISCRQYLGNRSNTVALTPISSATQSVSRLQSLLLERKSEPSEALEEIFKQCTTNPKDKIDRLLKLMGEKFVSAYCNDAHSNSSSPASRMISNDDNHPPSPPHSQSDEFARKRLQLGIAFYYKILENILVGERKRIPAEKLTQSLSTILDKDSFHLSLFACSLEIVLFSYNGKRTFPWILDAFGETPELRVHPFNFYKVIEPIIREEDGLSRDVVKHLNSIEEKILESYAWKSDSPLWDCIRGPGVVPLCVDVSLPAHTTGNAVSADLSSPISLLKRQNETQSTNSPLAERFSSPFKSTAKRQLFSPSKADSPSIGSHITGLHQQQGQIVQMVIPAKTESGEIQYIQVPVQAFAVALPSQQNSPNVKKLESRAENIKPPKMGPIGLFFRKVYTLAGLRLRDLCERLNISDEDIRRKIWTCFEYSLKQHTDLMRDRHLDQLIMCAIYAICKVTRQATNFHEIIKCYRLQPQATSHVYRSVLTNPRQRRNSGNSDTSRNSGSNSPLLQEERDRMRSSSTLPVPHPNSQPPTPTRVAGTGTHFEFEDRGDVISFYNQVYLPELSDKYILKFAVGSANASPPLSPLPRLNANPMSPFRRVSSKFPVYISPLKIANFPPSPNRPMSYRFQSSPAKDLRAINNMMRGGNQSKRSNVSKRIFQDDTESENSPTKRQCVDTMSRKIRDVVSERQIIESNGGLSNGNASENAD